MDDSLKARDFELISAFKAGDETAFDRLLLDYSPKLFRVAFGLLGNKQDAEEVVQDAFVRAYKALPDFRGDSSFETWMHRITVNLARNRFHWNRRRGEGKNVSLSAPSGPSEESVPSLDMDLPDKRLEPDRLLESQELESIILKAMYNLPDSLKEAMILRHVEDLPYDTIASMLKCKIGTVKSRLARGREILRNYMLSVDQGKTDTTRIRTRQAIPPAPEHDNGE